MTRFPLDKLTSNKVGIEIQEARVTVATPPGIWSYLAIIAPTENAQAVALQGAFAITVKLIVESGTIGVGILVKDKWDILLDEGFVEAGTGLNTVQLFVDDIDASGHLVFRNAGERKEPIVFTVASIEVRPIAEQAALENRNTLFAVYDLNIFPPSYDFSFFLMAAEMARCDAGLNDIHVIFVPANKEALRRLPAGFDAAVDGEARQWRFFHIVLPLLRLLPSVQGFSMTASRNEARAMIDRAEHRFPNPCPPNEVPVHTLYKHVNEKLYQNKACHRLRAASSATKYVRQWLAPRAKGRKLVTFTFRQYKFDPDRNSDLANWAAFARGLDKKEFFPVIIPDTDAAMDEFADEFEGIDIFSVGAFDLELRMAIYQDAWLNMMTTGGPCTILFLGEQNRFLIFRFLIPNLPLCSEKHLKELGMPVGGQFLHHSPMQRMVWETDSLSIIQREFDAMRAVIDGDRRKTA